MTYKIDNAIVKKDVTGKLTLIDPDNVFADKSWRELGAIPENESLKNLFVRLGYSKEDVANMIKEF